MSKTLFDLHDKVAVISGGNGGIGYGYATGIVKHGGNVCIWGSNPDKNKNASEQLKKFGTTVHAVTVDVSNEAAVDKASAETLDKFGRVDGCIANAGVGSGQTRFHEINEENWRRVLDVNLDGFMYTLRAAARHMIERAEAGDPGGRLIGTSSVSAHIGYAKAAAYAGSKAAVIAIMQGLAVEYARHQITANSILPGLIETSMTARAVADEEFTSQIMPRIPARRYGTPDDFEAIAAYLMSDASSYHTGDNITIDGGFVMS